jgi:hypothetical protein
MLCYFIHPKGCALNFHESDFLTREIDRITNRLAGRSVRQLFELSRINVVLC